MYGHKGHAFLPACSLLHLFPPYNATNTVTLSETLRQNILIVQRVHFTFSVKVYQEIMAVSSHEARLPYPASLMPDTCANWIA